MRIRQRQLIPRHKKFLKPFAAAGGFSLDNYPLRKEKTLALDGEFPIETVSHLRSYPVRREKSLNGKVAIEICELQRRARGQHQGKQRLNIIRVCVKEIGRLA